MGTCREQRLLGFGGCAPAIPALTSISLVRVAAPELDTEAASARAGARCPPPPHPCRRRMLPSIQLHSLHFISGRGAGREIRPALTQVARVADTGRGSRAKRPPRLACVFLAAPPRRLSAARPGPASLFAFSATFTRPRRAAARGSTPGPSGRAGRLALLSRPLTCPRPGAEGASEREPGSAGRPHRRPPGTPHL